MEMEMDNANQDRLSELGDDIILHILRFTKSYRATVRCSAVSRRFKGFYTLLPSLHLDARDLLPPNTADMTITSSSDTDLFGTIVRDALRQHRAPQLYLHLTPMKESMDRAGWWISGPFQLRFLHLSSVQQGAPVPLLYSNTLFLLKLDGLFLDDIESRSTLPSLCVLFLQQCKFIGFQNMRLYISDSPRLRYLIMETCRSLFFFCIYSTTLFSLTIINCKLQHGDGLNIHCPGLESLTLDYQSIHGGYRIDTPPCPTALPPLFAFLSTLAHLDDFSFSFPTDPHSASPDFLTSSPFPALKKVSTIVRLRKAVVEILELGEEEKFVISQLLLNSPKLTLLSIHLHTRLPEETYRSIFEQVAACKTASPHVEITISNAGGPHHTERCD